MKRLALGTLALAVAVLISGCGSSVESILEDQIKIDEEAADLAAGMKTAADVEASRAKFEDLGKRSVAILKKMASHRGGSPADIDAAVKKVQGRADAAKKRLEAAPPEVQQAIMKIISETAMKEAGR